MRINQEMLFDVAAREAAAIGSKYRDTCKCRDDLYDFMDANEWFGLDVNGTGRDTCVKGLESCLDRIILWLRAYKRTDAERLTLLLTEYGNRFPVLCREFGTFVKEIGCEDKGISWQVLDYLLSSISEDVDRWQDDQYEHLVRNASRFCTAEAARMMAGFFGWSDGRSGRERWEYRFHRRCSEERRNGAYDTESFCRMAYLVFDKEAWDENDLVGKACRNRNYASLWLFISLHFICGLRSTDMKRLPPPVLPFPGTEVRGMILTGTFPDRDLVKIASDWQYLLETVGRTPDKTRRFGGIPDLNVFIPTTLLAPMGMILAIAGSFCGTGEGFVRTGSDFLGEKRFFGEAFSQAAGYRRFSTRMANKSYLQGIEFVADREDGPGKLKGYMIAALARSHKASYGVLPKTTDIYLSDAAFSGYKPDYILREMFERGIFGFIPVLLLEQFYGEDYRKLDVSTQTQLIREIGLTAVQMEGVTEAVGKALLRAGDSVRDILIQGKTGKGAIDRILHCIADGSAAAKQEGYLCLRNAAGLDCPFPERSGCTGCGYEVYTKAALHLLMEEYVRISRLRRERAADSQRLAKILEGAVLPAVWEIIRSIETLYPGADITDVLDIIERGIRNAGSD